jgi:NAD(P)-dependent dehydrogenase (short-subunit alcohol dehydrogenase family)
MSLDLPAPFHLTEKVAVVTGASSGLGSRFARILASAGAEVVVVARRRDRLESLAGEINKTTGREVHPVECDLSRSEGPARVVDEAVSRFGRLDIVVNNAGISRVVPAVDDDWEGFEYEQLINLVAPFDISRRAASWMLDNEQTGSIVNIASVMGLVGGGRLRAAGYAASKGGLVNLTRELASQWARNGIRVNAIAPGWFASEMTEEMFESEGGMAFITTNTPMGRPGAEHELDGALLFLASDASSYVTGQILAVDGGWTAI